MIFIDGEFWHGYQWEKRKLTLKSNRDFWIPKIERNMQRDQEVNTALKQQGYKVFRFWEREVKTQLGRCLYEVLLHLERQSMIVNSI